MARDRYARYTQSMTEAQILKAVKDYVLSQHGIFWHIRNAKAQDVQFCPDILCVLPPRAHHAPGQVCFWEVKTQKDVLSDGQREALFLLDRATEIVSGVIRPVPKDVLIEVDLDSALAAMGKQD